MAEESTTQPISALFGRTKPDAEAVQEGTATRAFGEQGGGDENNQLQTADQVEAITAKAAAQTELSQLKSDSIDQVTALEVALDPPAPEYTTFSSSPISRLRVGRFQFDKGMLRLTGDDLTDFEKLMESMPTLTQVQVKKINLGAANAVAESFLESRRHRGVDTSENRPGIS